MAKIDIDEVEVEVEDETEERWLKHYSSFHRILLVGEGDFSFSLSLALSFRSASNIVATSLDSYDDVTKKYKKAKSNLEILEKWGASLLYGVDATKINLHTDIKMQKFDRIVYNFPHAGFYGKEDGFHIIKMHRNLVHGFFRSARGMLRPDGEIHVNHKTTAPFCHWNLEELAIRNSLALIECVDFKIEDYPGYNNKRGSGLRCDESFPLRQCSTFKFRFSPAVKKMPRLGRNMDQPNRYQELQEIPILRQIQPHPFEFGRPLSNFHIFANGAPGLVGFPPPVIMSSECSRIFDGYFNHVLETFGQADYDVGFHVREALRFGFERYFAEGPGRSLTGYINLLQELHHLSTVRSTWLQKKLLSANSNL